MIGKREAERFPVYVPDTGYQYQVPVRCQSDSETELKADGEKGSNFH